jgi:hypothetical protein
LPTKQVEPGPASSESVSDIPTRAAAFSMNESELASRQKFGSSCVRIMKHQPRSLKFMIPLRMWHILVFLTKALLSLFAPKDLKLFDTGRQVLQSE